MENTCSFSNVVLSSVDLWFAKKEVHLWLMSFVFLSWAWGGGGVVVKSCHKDTEVNQNHWQPILLNLARPNPRTHPMLHQ